MLIRDQDNNKHTISDIAESEGEYTRLQWTTEDEVIESFNEESQEVILEVLENTTDGEYFA